MGDTGYWVAYTSATMQEIPPLVLQQPSSRQPIMSALALTPARTLPNLSVCGPYTATPGCVSVGVWHCSKQGTTPSKSLSQPTRVKQVPSDKTRFPCTDLSPIRGFFTSDSLCSLVADPDTAALLPSADSFYSDGSSVFSEAEQSPPLSPLRSPTNSSPRDQHKPGNNAFTTPGTGNVSALFPRSLSELSESSNAPSPRSSSSQFSDDKAPQSPTNSSPQDQHKPGNNAFTTPGTGNVSALFPRSLSELSESSNAPSPRSISSQFSDDKGAGGVSKVLDGARCPHRKSWKRLRAKKCGAKWRTRGTMDSEEIFEDA